MKSYASTQMVNKQIFASDRKYRTINFHEIENEPSSPWQREKEQRRESGGPESRYHERADRLICVDIDTITSGWKAK